MASAAGVEPATFGLEVQEENEEYEFQYDNEPLRIRNPRPEDCRKEKDRLANLQYEMQQGLSNKIRQTLQIPHTTFLDNRLYMAEIAIITGKGMNAECRNAFSIHDAYPFDPLKVPYWTTPASSNNRDNIEQITGLATEIESFTRFSTYSINEETREGVVERVNSISWELNGPHLYMMITTRQLDPAKAIKWKTMSQVEVEFLKENGERLLHPLVGHVMTVTTTQEDTSSLKTVVFNEKATLHLIINGVTKEKNLITKIHLPTGKTNYQKQILKLTQQRRAAIEENKNKYDKRLQRAYFGKIATEDTEGGRMNGWTDEDEKAIRKQLNEEQFGIVNQLLEAPQPISLVMGPGGCGKSTLISAYVEALLRRNKKQILIVTSSNAAADSLMEKLLDVTTTLEKINNRTREVMVNKNEILRHYNQYRIKFDLAPFEKRSTTAAVEELNDEQTVHMRQERDKLRSQILNEFNKEHSEIKKEDLFRKTKKIDELEKELMKRTMKIIKPSVIVTTTAAIDDSVLTEQQFSHVLVDEASMITKSDLANICQKVERKPTNQTTVILVGDPEQLSPANHLPQSHPLHKYASLSALEMMISINSYPNYELRMNYRSNSTLTDIVSKLFYNNRLRCGSDESHRITNMIPNWTRPPYMVITTSHPEQPIGTGYINRGEVRIVQIIVAYLLRNGATKQKIAVITPYEQQAKLMKKEGVGQGAGQIETSDSFQGKESHIVIISMVRSPRTKSDIAFYTRKRMCVAMTRAQTMMIVIANDRMINQQEEVWQLSQWARFQGVFATEIDLDTLLATMEATTLSPAQRQQQSEYRYIGRFL